ncbi:MAG: ribulose-phosphate 3-epimerase [Thermoleophilia bacterium]|nr:ribulose-phosphate 3-epimerase [Thermoleophilia bacterium]
MAISDPVPAVLPSVMSADMLALGAQLDALCHAGARVFHVDVMDGHFVPNLTVGPDFTAAVARAVRPHGGAVDVHLMVERPGPLLELFAPYADAISVHAESDPHVHRLLGEIRRLGCRAGLAVNPGTPVAAVAELAEELDYVNCMSVNPGFAGQSFIATTPAKLARLRDALPDRVLLEVDGGIGPATLPQARDAGAQWLVSASAIFGQPDPVAAYTALAALAG